MKGSQLGISNSTKRATAFFLSGPAAMYDLHSNDGSRTDLVLPRRQEERPSGGSIEVGLLFHDDLPRPVDTRRPC